MSNPIETVKNIEYFSRFTSNYHFYNALSIKDRLDNLDSFCHSINLEHEKEQIKSSLELSLRFNFLHCIETLFEIIAGLLRLMEKNLDEGYLLYEISNSNGFPSNELAKKINDNPDFLDFLNEKIESNDFYINKAHYLFYDNCEIKSNDGIEFFNKNVESIKELLKYLAKELKDRDEINNFKHGLRFHPSSGTLLIMPQDGSNRKFEFKVGGYKSYLKTKNDKHYKFITVEINNSQNYAMTLNCAQLISNLINTRNPKLLCNDNIRLFDFTKIIDFSPGLIETSSLETTKLYPNT